MIQVNNNTYYETLEILRGDKKLPKIYVELNEWLYEKYHIHAYNFEFKEIHPNSPAHKFRLYILLPSRDEYRSMFKGYNFDNEKQTAIADKFYDLAKKYNLESIKNYKDAFVAYSDFSYDMRIDYFRRAYRLIEKELFEKYKIYSVWRIYDNDTTLVVFYQRIINVKTNWFIGISKQIKDEFYKTLHKLDEFNIFTYDNLSVHFDSKENFDNKFGGSYKQYFMDGIHVDANSHTL